MTDVVRLRRMYSTSLRARAPFNFRLTTWKPSHFVTGLEIHTTSTTWRSFRTAGYCLGVRLAAQPRRQIAVDVFCDKRLPSSVVQELVEHLEHGYGLDDDLRAFGGLVKRGGYARELAQFVGARASCPESVFEISIIALLLQNTTIARTTQMFRSLLADYGCVVRFDGMTLRGFFTPEEISGVTEQQLRSRNRLGYRAKYIPAFAEFFAGFDNERALQRDGRADLVAELQTIKGIGPYSANVIASSALRDTTAVPLDVWNVRILSRALFGRDDRTAADVRRALRRSFRGYEGLASLYLIEREYLEVPLDPLRATISEARRDSRARLET